MNLSKKQFVITNKKLNINDMSVTALTGAFLYTDMGLSITKVTDLSGKENLVIGYAFVSDAENKTIVEDVESWNGKDVSKLTYDWTGKWILISDKKIISDPTGLMPLFYYVEKDFYIISSSLCLISKITGKKPVKNVTPDGLSWQLLPYTIIEGVKKVLPLQCIEFNNDNINIKSYNWINQYDGLETHKKIDELSELLTTSIKNISNFSGKEIYLALTGGKDSRVTLSAALASGVKFKVYSFEHDNISSADKSIPKKISKDFNFDFEYIKKRNFDKEKNDNYLAFTVGNSRGADELFYSRGQFSKIPDDAIIIRSGLYEAGTLFYDKPLDDIHEWIENRYKKIKQDKLQAAAFDEWIKYTKYAPLVGVDIRYRFYLEQRVGGWASAIEQSMDMNDFVSVQIANNAHVLSLLLSATPEERQTMVFTRKIIEQLKPELLDYAFNKRTVFDYLRLIKNKL